MIALDAMPRLRWPLWLQLLVALSLVLVLVNLLTASMVRHVEGEYLFEQVEQQSRSSFSVLAATAIDAVITEDQPLLETIAEESLKRAPHHMVGLTILNEDNQQLVRRYRQDADMTARTKLYRYDLIFEGEQFGAITIQWDIEPVFAEIDRHITKVRLFITLMLILMTSLTILLLHWLAIRPVRRITRYLVSLSEEQEPSSPLQLSGTASRELAFLADSSNLLYRTMQQRDARENELLHTREQLQIAHDAALSASRAKSGFLAAMSHEIRTPMNAILGILDLLRDTSLNDRQRHLVNTGQESGELLLSIINDVLDFSKMEADKLVLENTHFDLHCLLTTTVELFRPEADRKRLGLELMITPGVPRYAGGDPDRLKQILLNLINNAIKFTSAGNVRLCVVSIPEGEEVFTLRCAVQDTGIGIPDAFQTALFDEFTMADQSHSRTHEGTGLGLAICKRLVSLMNGTIRVNSEVGNGSTFVFTIELEAVNEPVGKSEPALNTTPSVVCADVHLLLAEDNPANQLVIRSILEHAGFRVDIVDNGREAVEAVRQGTYDIVLMDISMPEMDGMAATREIRRLAGEAGRIPVVALTAHALQGDRERFLAAGMNDYLSKPIDRKATLHCITRWVENKVAQPDSRQPRHAVIVS